MLKRLFDFVVSLLALIFLLPFFFVIAALIKVNSGGPVFFLQTRVGQHGADFRIFKFRTMKTGSDKKGLLTIGNSDNRITGVGYYLRKYKLDEFPQLINVLIGNMSLVGPRPEVRKYVDLYNVDQLRVLDVKPGITDYASIKFSNESELLARSADPEQEYIERIMPEKLKLNLEYLDDKSVGTDIRILFSTLAKIMTSG
jgi:lipopolysaccharide/colanic/teichoic acid biosynthesis glycosyltransferase